MLNKNIKEKIFNEMLKETNHNIYTYRVKEGILTNNECFSGGINLNDKYYLSVPEEIKIGKEKIKLHGNTRNVLAKEFIKNILIKIYKKILKNIST